MNNSNIYIPKRINVGFQNRDSTYSGKLAYIIYYDEKGKLRKENSWNSWRDKNIPNEEFDNAPTEGFVLNKKVGGVEESWGYDPRRTYTRVYDPRGFEFEITIPNLLWILENCNCIKGKGLEGEFVYGWDKTDLILIPVDSPDYKNIKTNSDTINNNQFIKSSELVIGATYQGKNTDKWYIYLGRFDAYKKEWNDVVYPSYYSCDSWRYSEEDDGSWHEDPFCSTKYKYTNRGKHYWFMECTKSEYSIKPYESLITVKSVSNKFIKCLDDKCSEKYIEYKNKMESFDEFSPIDYDNVIVNDLPYTAFENKLIKIINNPYKGNRFYSIEKNQFGCYKKFEIKQKPYDHNILYADFGYGQPVKPLGRVPEDISFKKIYDELHPVYGIYYLKNGKEYKRIGWYEEDGTK